MKTFFGFVSTLNREPSATHIFIEIVLLLGNSIITCADYRRRPGYPRIPGYPRPFPHYPRYPSYPKIPRDCLDVNKYILTCKTDFYTSYDDDYPYFEDSCWGPCSDERGSHFSRYRSIDFSRKRIKEIDFSAQKCMKCITELDLSGNSLELHKPGDNFYNLGQLKTLKLSNNNIKNLTKSTFQSLVLLQELFLDFNQIEILTVGLFDKLVLLRFLDLQGNQLRDLSYQIMRSLIGLESLNLKSNNLRTLGTNTFNNTEKLKVLDLSRNSDLTLENDTFKGLTNLKQLFINSCGIASFPITLFCNIRGLRKLHINNNRLKEVSFETFGVLESLSEIHAISNNISVLKDKPFRHHGNLTIIDFTGNNIVHINNSDLEGLSSLKVLKLSSNSIQTVSQNSFKGMPLLEILVLKDNKIKTAFSFENNTKLKFIDISYNQLTEFRFSELEKLTRLESINISHNQLTEFRFSGLEKLTLLKQFKVTNNHIQNLSIPMLLPPNNNSVITPELHLESNRIERIMLITANESLSFWKFSLYLKGNSLVCDCRMYNLYRGLKDNTLSHVKFEDGVICGNPPPFKDRDIKKLKNDKFICNIEVSCPYNCECFYRASDRLRIVNCEKNNYTKLPDEIPPGIQILNIKDNRLTSLANLKEPCWENLTEIYAEGNEITHEEFHMTKNLKFLGLRDNKMEVLPEVIRKHAENYKDFTMTLSNNLWQCDCWILHLKVFLSMNGNQVIDKDGIRCTFPNDTVGFFNLISMPDIDICPDIHLYVFVIAFMLLILCFYILRRRYKLRISEIWKTQFPLEFRNSCCTRLRYSHKIFDCFLSYCLDDKSVAMAIVREMNKKPPRYKFCTHERNWTVDCQVTNSVSYSIQSSRSAIVVLSQASAKTEWFQMEFRKAFEQLQKDKQFKLILVVVGDIPDKSDLPVNVQFFLSSGMYLKFREKWFWHKLRETFRSLDVYLKLYIPEDASEPL